MYIYTDADYKIWLFTPTPVLCPCMYSFAMSTHVCNVFSKDFFYKFPVSRFECCFWSSHCTETQARTSDNVKTWVFISLNVKWWSFIDNVVYCNILRSIIAPLHDLEKAMFTGSTLVPMFTIIIPGPYTHSKQSKAFHAKCNLTVNREKKWVS